MSEAAEVSVHPVLTAALPSGRRPHAAVRQRGERRRRMNINFSFAPMIDLTFQFLIFFVAATRFADPEGNLSTRMPRDVGPQAVALPLTPIVVRIQPAGTDAGEVILAIDKFDLHPADFEELVPAIRSILGLPGFDAETPVVIAADNAVSWDHVVSAWNAALRAGATRLAFGDS